VKIKRSCHRSCPPDNGDGTIRDKEELDNRDGMGMKGRKGIVVGRLSRGQCYSKHSKGYA
jgi:hypothetical protein